MKYKLNKILSKDTLNCVENYVNDGKDAISLMGHKNDTTIANVVEYFQALANPEFVNAREIWGNQTSSAPYETLENLSEYADGKHNSFALKFRSNNGFNVKFPLVHNFYDVDGSFKNVNCLSAKQIFATLENYLNFKLYFQDNKSELVKAKEGALKKVVGVISNPIKSFTAKQFEDRFKVAENGGLTTTKLIVSNYCDGQKLTTTEQVIAVLDYFSKKVNKQVAKKSYKLNNVTDGGKILLGSELLTDLYLSYAFDLGKENNIQVENALKLQLSNVIASLKSEESIKAMSIIAHRSVSILFKKLYLKPEYVVNNRKFMGIQYLQKPENTYDMMFGETKNSSFVKNGEDLFYNGQSPYFERVSKNIKQESVRLNDAKLEENTPEKQKVNVNDILDILSCGNTKQSAPSESVKPQEINTENKIFENVVPDEEIFEEEPIKIENQNIAEEPVLDVEEGIKEEIQTTPNVINLAPIQEDEVTESQEEVKSEEAEEIKVEEPVIQKNVIEKSVEQTIEQKVETKEKDESNQYLKIEAPKENNYFKLEVPENEEDKYYNLGPDIEKALKNPSRRRIEDFLNIDDLIEKAEKGRTKDEFLEINEPNSNRISFEEFENKLQTKLSDFPNESQTKLNQFNDKTNPQKKLTDFNDKVQSQKKLTDFNDKVDPQKKLFDFNDKVDPQKKLNEFNDVINPKININNAKNDDVYVSLIKKICAKNIQIINNNVVININEKSPVSIDRVANYVKDLPVNKRKEFLIKLAEKQKIKQGQTNIFEFVSKKPTNERKEFLNKINVVHSQKNAQKQISDFDDLTENNTPILLPEIKHKSLVESTGKSPSPRIPNVFFDNSNVILCGPVPKTNKDDDINNSDGQELKLLEEPKYEIEFEKSRITTRRPHANRQKRKFATSQREKQNKEEIDFPKQNFTEEEMQIILANHKTNIQERQIALTQFNNFKNNLVQSRISVPKNTPKITTKTEKIEINRFKEKKQIKVDRNKKFVDKTYQTKKMPKQIQERKMFK